MKIIIFTPTQDISTNPTLINLIYRLSEDGIPVDIYQPKQGCHLPLETNNKNVKLFKHHYFTPVIISEFSCYSFIFLFYRLTRSIIYLPKKLWILLKLFFGDHLVVLAVDPRGVIEAYKYLKWLKVPFVYFSFEIFFMNELHSIAQIKIKKKEIVASQKAAFIVVQDPQRGKLLEIENSISNRQIFYMPVAPSSTPLIKKSSYLREKFKISKNKTIVIHAGSLASWTCAEELINNARQWPEEFVLVLHIRHNVSEDKYVNQLIRSNETHNIIFSTDPCNYFMYHELLSSSDIGLVFYKPIYKDPYTGKNIETIGLSSGKLSYFMKCGIPTISFKQQCYKNLLREYKFGLVIEDFSELPDALLNVKENRTKYSHEAKRLFYEKLNFDIYYPALKKKLFDLLK